MNESTSNSVKRSQSPLGSPRNAFEEVNERPADTLSGHLYSPKKLTHVTPELAAAVVKEYLLPLFEADDKKFIHSKGKVNIPSLSHISRNASPGAMNTVYEELKLSETLSNELTRVTNKLSATEAALEAAKMENTSLLTQIIETTKREDKLRNQIQSQLATQDQAVKKLEKAEKNSQAFEQQISMLKTQLEKFETTYKKVCQELQTEKNKNQGLAADINELKQKLVLCNIERESYTKTTGEMRRAHDVFMEGYGNRSRFQLEMEAMQKVLKENAHSLSSVQNELTESISERDRQRRELKDLANARTLLLAEKEKALSTLREKIAELEKTVRELEKDLEARNTEYEKLEKKYRQAMDEKEKMRQRIIKMKMRKIANPNQKLCKNCGREYLETENFNWSCRTHRSEFGGQMWWCCGKTNKDAPGCKYSKHVSKEDEDDVEEMQMKDDGDKAKSKKIKCQTCKEVGHKAEDCPRDPNVRTGHDGKKELERIKAIKECKKIINDTVDQTMSLFSLALKNNKNQGNIMAKGALMFSDYNYHPFNPKLLVEHEDESVQGKENEGEDSESKSEPMSGKVEDANKDTFRRGSTRRSLPKDEIEEIVTAQQQDELADLVPLKICVQSDNYGTNNLFKLDNLLVACTKSQRLPYIRSGTVMSALYSIGGGDKTDRGLERSTARQQPIEDYGNKNVEYKMNEEFAGAFRTNLDPAPVLPGAVVELTTANLRKFNSLNESPIADLIAEFPKKEKVEEEKKETPLVEENVQEKLVTEEKPSTVLDTDQQLLKDNKDEYPLLEDSKDKVDTLGNLPLTASSANKSNASRTAGSPDGIFFQSRFLKLK